MATLEAKWLALIHVRLEKAYQEKKNLKKFQTICKVVQKDLTKGRIPDFFYHLLSYSDTLCAKNIIN